MEERCSIGCRLGESCHVRKFVASKKMNQIGILSESERTLLTLRTEIEFCDDESMCDHHRYKYVVSYSNWQMYCSDPRGVHKRKITAGLKVLNKIETAKKYGIKPGGKLCLNCILRPNPTRPHFVKKRASNNPDYVLPRNEADDAFRVECTSQSSAEMCARCSRRIDSRLRSTKGLCCQGTCGRTFHLQCLGYSSQEATDILYVNLPRKCNDCCPRSVSQTPADVGLQAVEKDHCPVGDKMEEGIQHPTPFPSKDPVQIPADVAPLGRKSKRKLSMKPQRSPAYCSPPHNLCQHFIKGDCRYSMTCQFLHPGINGPPLFPGDPVQIPAEVAAQGKRSRRKLSMKPKKFQRAPDNCGPPRIPCRHFMAGCCRYSMACLFLHPGINGPHLL